MKLRNKKTGEIVEVESCNSTDGTIGLFFYEGRECDRAYNSLAELNEDWEDYEEPKDSIEYIGLDWEDYDHTTVEIQYQTKEEAEKAVEKLKAWKRLRDKGFRFNGETCDYKPDKHFGSVFFETDGYLLDVYEDTSEFYDDLNLLFGGER